MMGSGKKVSVKVGQGDVFQRGEVRKMEESDGWFKISQVARGMGFANPMKGFAFKIREDVFLYFT